MKRYKLKQAIKEQKGATVVVVALMMVILMGFAAVVIDAGLVYIDRQRLVNTVDAAALAAAQDLVLNEGAAVETAKDYIRKNGFDPADFRISASSSDKAVEVRGGDDVHFLFARLMGFMGTHVNSRSKAAIRPLTGTNGIRPLAVEKLQFVYGQQYRLKEGAGDSYNGNFGPVALGGTGASNYRNNLKYGYAAKLKTGDWISTETGNMPTPTIEGIDYLMNQCPHTPKCTITRYVPDCPRLVTIPVVDTLQVNGRGQVQVVGFARFLLAGTVNDGGHMEVVGWFVRDIVPGDMGGDGQDFGLYGVKLIQ